MNAPTKESTLLDLEGMLGETMDNIPDAPDYATPPAGEYRLQVKDSAVDKYKPKAGGSAQRLKNTYTILSTLSTASNEIPVPDGSMFTETFQATEMGLGYFKARIKSIMGVSDLNGVSLGDMMAGVKGTSFDARITIKTSPKDATNPAAGSYENVQIRVISSASTSA